MNKPDQLIIPKWVPQHLTQLITDHHLKNIYLPNDFYGDYQAGYVRLATDERMRTVWQEVYKRQGIGGQERPFVNPANKDNVRAWAQQMQLEYISAEKEDFIRIQDQAAALLFFKASGNLIWDRRFDVGPRVKTKSEISARKIILKNLVKRHLEDAETYKKIGKIHVSMTLNNLAADLSEEINMERNFDNNPWIVERESNRVGDAWERGTMIELGQICLILFKKKMLRTVAVLSNVLLDRNDITHHALQGILKHIS